MDLQSDTCCCSDVLSSELDGRSSRQKRKFFITVVVLCEAASKMNIISPPLFFWLLSTQASHAPAFPISIRIVLRVYMQGWRKSQRAHPTLHCNLYNRCSSHQESAKTYSQVDIMKFSPQFTPSEAEWDT